MKPTKLYSNQSTVFEPIEFQSDLNVILAEIRLPENRNRDTHNLGKTTVGRLLDFGFLSGRDNKFFLFKHSELFKEFIFFLEIELLDGTYVTVRRSASEASKASFKKHHAPHQDFTTLPDGDWDHLDVPFDRARELLDSLLNLDALKPWHYRKVLGYFLRSQEDYRDVFQLRKFASAHSDWKPFLAHILGFNDELISQHYAKEKELEEKEHTAATVRAELGGHVDDSSKIDGLLLLKRQDLERKQALLDSFDFRKEDKDETRRLVDQIDQQISELNQRRYSLMLGRKKVIASLEENQILFNPDEAARLFQEANVVFEGQIKRDFEQLLTFNRAITEERRAYLADERNEIENELKITNSELNTLGRKRTEILSFLSSTDSFDKYKKLSNELVSIRTDIEGLERQREFIHRLQQLRADIRTVTEEKIHLQSAIETDVEAVNADKDSLFSSIRLFFNEVVESVIDQKALLSVIINQQGHLEFRAEILDSAGSVTSADRGFSYKKLLCIAFDLAILRAHIGDAFPRFVFHDGVFETLDNRKKEKLLEVIRQYTALGLQETITLIDSDKPPRNADSPVFSEEEVVVHLHDEGEDGRLFKMKTW